MEVAWLKLINQTVTCLNLFEKLPINKTHRLLNLINNKFNIDIFKKNRSGELIDRNDVIATLHLTYVDCFNEFQKKYGYKVADKATLQKPINLSESSDDQEITFC